MIDLMRDVWYWLLERSPWLMIAGIIGLVLLVISHTHADPRGSCVHSYIHGEDDTRCDVWVRVTADSVIVTTLPAHPRAVHLSRPEREP